jgi:hypothetical protein
MNAADEITRIEAMLKRGQMVPSKMIRDLVTDCKAQLALNQALKKRIAELEAAEKAKTAEAQS